MYVEIIINITLKILVHCFFLIMEKHINKTLYFNFIYLFSNTLFHYYSLKKTCYFLNNFLPKKLLFQILIQTD